MRIIARTTLEAFWTERNYKDSEQSLKAWYEEAKKAVWISPQDIKDKYRNASFLANNRVVFNICGNKYRLVVALDYPRKAVYIKFVGTHKEYDRIDASEVNHEG